ATRPADRLPADRWLLAARGADPAAADRQGRPALDLDHVRRHPGQGDPRPADDANGGEVSRVWLRGAQGLPDARPPVGNGPARSEPAAPALVHFDPNARRAGGGRLCQSIRSGLAARRSPKTTCVAWVTKSLPGTCTHRPATWTWWRWTAGHWSSSRSRPGRATASASRRSRSMPAKFENCANSPCTT